ncbi:PAXIP1-associated glutamate-rich protein 1 [Motacilla alba alba]|uniref:PAXIP1-associated glutamate-rich protein 1 n=1 Tax=Motacilla alba alba TaxID=1094192 RepID=UPI0018D504DD|nr:PAXIP1-associated glutamate-rich protein 1 [Motacilla alba alba]
MSTPRPSPPSPLPPSLHSLSLTPPPKSPPASPERPRTPPERPPEPPGSPPSPPEEEWGVPWSEEDEEEPPGGWTPEPPEIRRLYEAIARAGVLPLRNLPFPRRLPTPEPPCPPEPGAAGAASPSREAQEEKPPPPTEFDFDDEPLPPNPALIDRRRTPGPPSRGQKREARLDKVLSDMKRHKKLEEQILRTGRDLFPPEGPQSPKRPPGLFLRTRKY